MINWDEESINANLVDLLESQRWEGFEAYLRQELAKQYAGFLKCSDPNVILVIQGRCKSMNDLLQLRNNLPILKSTSTPDNRA